MRGRGPGITGGHDVIEGTGAELYVEDRATHPWSRYVALGDSFTEGVGDPEPGSIGGLRGWADRVAEELATDGGDFCYANLAVRGLLLQQILDQQIGQALALEPDLVTLSAGGNDMVFHGSDPDKLAGKLESGVSLLAETGATIVLFTGPDWGATPVLGRNRAKVAVFNENVHAIAARHGALVTDLWALRQLRDPRMWDPDRLHLSPLGHHTVAAAVLDALSVRHTLVPLEPKELPGGSRRQARGSDLAWARTYLFTWVLRKLWHQSAGEDRRAKRPTAAPVFERGNGSGQSPALIQG